MKDNKKLKKKLKTKNFKILFFITDINKKNYLFVKHFNLFYKVTYLKITGFYI